MTAEHEFTEDIGDASMCICGVPGLNHERVYAPDAVRMQRWREASKATTPNPFRPIDAGWSPGDECVSCGSTDTGWTAELGAHCRTCGKADSDE